MHSQVLYHEGGDASGLQVLCDGDDGGEGGGGGEDGGGGGEGGGGEGGGWVDVGARPGALIVNVGDILHYWSNGLLKRARRRSLPPRGLSPLEKSLLSASRSARHRVLGGGWRSRLSLVYFCMPGYDTRIEAPAVLLAGAIARLPRCGN